MPGTPFSEMLPRPEAWKSSPDTRYKISVIGLSVLSTLDLLLVIYFYSNGETSYGTGGLCFGLMLVAMLVIGIDGKLRMTKPTVSSLRNTSGQTGRPALKVPYSLVQFVGYLALMSVIGVSFVLAGVVTRDPGESFFNGGTVVYLVLALIFLSFPVIAILGKFRRGKLILSEDGVYQRGWTFESFLPWSSIELIDAIERDGPYVRLLGTLDQASWQRKQFTRLWRQDRLPPVQSSDPAFRVMELPAKDIATDLTLVYHLLGFYYLHPNNRTELGTTAAIERARLANLGS